METIFRKSLALFAALLVMVGGFLVFTSERVEAATSEQVEAATSEQVEAAGRRTIRVCQNGPYIANLCIKNRSRSNNEKCTGNIPAGAKRELTFPWKSGDRLSFIAAVKDGHNAYYDGLADRDRECWSDGSSLSPGAYCRTRNESEC